jgi:hypothetical protein
MNILIETERDQERYNERQGERISVGSGVVVDALVARVALIDPRNFPRDPTAPSKMAFNIRAPQL